ncbi:MAG: hypothetical protein EOS78_31585 [Mesorhizobium sp.]|nr:MAG: hypothetical protein EOS78_31585 [Mesorhizobium sp.]
MLSVHSVTYLSGSDTGILSPYSDGEREAVVSVAKKRAALRQPLSPRLRGEMSGRTVRGSADGDRHAR